MNNTLKMKHLFPDVFEVEGNPSFEPQELEYYCFGELKKLVSPDQETIIQEAVLGWDDLVEKVKTLEKREHLFRELLDWMVDEVKTYSSEVECEDGGVGDFVDIVAVRNCRNRIERSLSHEGYCNKLLQKKREEDKLLLGE